MRNRYGNFDFYTSIAAKFNSVGSCGHPIKKGDTIGWNGRLKKTSCATCWAKWKEENAEAADYKRNLPEGMNGY